MAPVPAQLGAGHWYTADEVRKIRSSATKTAQEYKIALSSPAYERLTEIVQGFFTRATPYREGQGPANEEIRFYAKIVPEFIEGGETGMQGIIIRIFLTITDAEDHQLASVEASSNKLSHRHGFSWTLKGIWGKIAAVALNEAFDALIGKIHANQPLKAQLRELAQNRELPASISTTVRFNDEAAILPNGISMPAKRALCFSRFPIKGLERLMAWHSE